MNSPDSKEVSTASVEFPLIQGRHSYGEVTDKISGLVTDRPVKSGWLIALSFSFLLLMLFLLAITVLLVRGIGIWGVNIPVAWGFAITNFVWWVGIGHAGTFISAILFLLHQEWRTSINRFAEAMTLFAVACAGLMPLLHLGRPWFFYWLVPYPDTMDLWPQFRSPLVWDVFAVSTYLTVSFVFWYIGLIPDAASLRDRSKKQWQKITYGIIALGWRGSAKHWERYQKAYLLLAGLATPLVISVHSVVSLDFTASIVPGWHSTIFPPYFVAGAIFSGFAMVLSLGIPLRKFYSLQDFITLKHLENCAKLLLVTGMIVTYSYVMEAFMAWYGGDPYDRYIQLNRAFGNYWPVYWLLLVCNVVVPQFLWFKRVRTNVSLLFIISLLINIGMWAERFIIVVTSLHRDFMPSAWHMYWPTFWDWATLTGSVGLFLFLFLLFVRSLPVIAIFELRELLHKTPVFFKQEKDRTKTILPDNHGTNAGGLYGVVAEFDNPESLIHAGKSVYREGFRKLDTFTPYPVEGVAQAIGFKRERVAFITLLGGIIGGALAFGMQWYSNVIDYPTNVGGRPDFSWPSFFPVTFELTVLGAALSAAFGMLAFNRLPRLWHPVFNVPGFERASRDRFFLFVNAKDPKFDLGQVRALLQRFQPLSLREVDLENEV